MRLPFEAEAFAELEAAATHYESERRGYGALFVSEVRRAVERAAELPWSGHRVLRTRRDHDARRFVVRRFPFAVITAIVAGQRAVVAIAHTARRPRYWRDRLK